MEVYYDHRVCILPQHIPTTTYILPPYLPNHSVLPVVCLHLLQWQWWGWEAVAGGKRFSPASLPVPLPPYVCSVSLDGRRPANYHHRPWAYYVDPDLCNLYIPNNNMKSMSMA